LPRVAVTRPTPPPGRSSTQAAISPAFKCRPPRSHMAGGRSQSPERCWGVHLGAASAALEGSSSRAGGKCPSLKTRPDSEEHPGGGPGRPHPRGALLRRPRSRPAFKCRPPRSQMAGVRSQSPERCWGSILGLHPLRSRGVHPGAEESVQV
jgi:hypothetical protein